MRLYRNHRGDSGVIAYEIAPDSIMVQFRTGTYLYNSVKPGREHVERMKELAEEGLGLGTYISKTVRHNFFAKIA